MAVCLYYRPTPRSINSSPRSDSVMVVFSVIHNLDTLQFLRVISMHAHFTFSYPINTIIYMCHSFSPFIHVSLFAYLFPLRPICHYLSTYSFIRFYSILSVYLQQRFFLRFNNYTSISNSHSIIRKTTWSDIWIMRSWNTSRFALVPHPSTYQEIPQHKGYPSYLDHCSDISPINPTFNYMFLTCAVQYTVTLFVYSSNIVPFLQINNSDKYFDHCSHTLSFISCKEKYI